TQTRGIEGAVGPQRPPEGTALKSTVDALDPGMHPGASAGDGARSIRHHCIVTHRDPQQRGGRVAPTTTEARSYGFHTTPVLLCASSRACRVVEPVEMPHSVSRGPSTGGPSTDSGSEA